MLMFKRTFWRNHVEDQDGKVIQQGTLLEQDQFNRMEVGISDSNMAANIIHIMLLWFGRRLGVLETSSNSHDTDIASIKTLNGQQDTRLAALEKTTGSHTTDIASMKNTDTQQNSCLSALKQEVAAEVKEVTLKNGSKWPFGINEVSVGLAKTRKNANYGVDVYVKSYTGGRLGDITVSGKLTNGFKLKHDGSAQTVVVVVRVTGGMN